MQKFKYLVDIQQNSKKNGEGETLLLEFKQLIVNS
jgi:hypothetical protein